MKTKQNLIKKLNRCVFLVVIILSISSCTVTFIPDYDSSIAQQIDETAKAVDLFYLKMLETTTTENNKRDYKVFAEKYVEIEVEINSLLNKNKVRALNENSTKICELTLKLWQKYKEEHKTDTVISNGIIKMNRVYMSDMFNAMQVAENAKKIIANSQ